MEKYLLNNQVEKVLRGENSVFLNPIDVNYIVNILNKRSIKYNIFKLYKDTEKMVIYTGDVGVKLFEIECSSLLIHKEILGALFSLNISEYYYGDIIAGEKSYIVVLDSIASYLESNLVLIGKKKVHLIERDICEVSDFVPDFEDVVLNVNSLRIDNVISKIIPTSRSITDTLIEDGQVVLNYDLLKNKFYNLKEGDIFSVRRVGKFKFMGVNKVNKNGKFNVSVYKYK